MSKRIPRDGLPQDLVNLLNEFPRHLWPENQGFHGLAAFWLERHLAFRAVMDQLTKDTKDFAEARLDHEAWAHKLARLGGHLVQDLTGHHQIEDHAYFPQMQLLEPRMAQGFELLDKDHHELHQQIDGFVDTANAILRSPHRTIDDGLRMVDCLDGFSGFLNRHLEDEEDLVIPVILKHGMD